MQQIKNATNSRNEACRGDTEISTRQLTTFVFLINFEADPNGNDYYTEFDISMDGLQEAIDNLEINTDKLDEAIGNLEEKAPVDSDVPTAIKCLYTNCHLLQFPYEIANLIFNVF